MIVVRNIMNSDPNFCEESLCLAINRYKSMSASVCTRTLLGVLTEKLISCDDIFDSSSIVNAVRGIRNLDFDCSEVIALLEALKMKTATRINRTKSNNLITQHQHK